MEIHWPFDNYILVFFAFSSLQIYSTSERESNDLLTDFIVDRGRAEVMEFLSISYRIFGDFVK